MNGRPSKLTPDRRKALIDAIKAGNHIVRACHFAGIDKSTFYKWKKKAADARSGEFVDFIKEIEEAESQAQIRMVAQWQAQIPHDWRAAREFLARRFPDEWSSLEKREISGDSDNPIVFEIDLGGELDDGSADGI